MKEIKSGRDVAYVQSNYLNERSCAGWIKKAKNPSAEVCKQWTPTNEVWSERVVDITNYPIVQRVKYHLDETLDMDLTLTRAEIQTWMTGTRAMLHLHLGDEATWNSMIYLNSDFEGGHFFSSDGLVIKPEPGLLTLFKGKKVLHGVGEVKGKDRYTLIFWWK